MITRIEAKNFRCLRYISQEVAPFQILVGPNASGKTTFLDVISFLADVVKGGIDSAVFDKRTRNFQNLTFGNEGGDIELAIELLIPESQKLKLNGNGHFDRVRYELKFGIDEKLNLLTIKGERVLLFQNSMQQADFSQTKISFPEVVETWSPVVEKVFKPKGFKMTLRKKEEGQATFIPETSGTSRNPWQSVFNFGNKKSALANLPEDESKFPVSVWLKEFLLSEVQLFILNSQKIREASQPGQGNRFLPDGSNLPWMIDFLSTNYPLNYQRWIAHLQTGLPDLTGVVIQEFPDTRYKYLKLRYQNGLDIPSWTASDGTLRFLALTLLAYLPDFRGIYLIEEPENGIHPKIMESVYQSLSSVYEAQILVASHSPVFLSIAQPADILCFAKTGDGETDIVRGDRHPMLKNWQGEINFSSLFASGILG